MAMDQHQTFNWLVAENGRLEAELAAACAARDVWASKAFDLALDAAKNNPAVRAKIEAARKAETPAADVLNFVLR